MAPTKSIFVDAVKAAAIVGLSVRHFRRRYVESGLLPVLRFNKSKSHELKGDGKHIFLRADVEKLKESHGTR